VKKWPPAIWSPEATGDLNLYTGQRKRRVLRAAEDQPRLVCHDRVESPAIFNHDGAPTPRSHRNRDVLRYLTSPTGTLSARSSKFTPLEHLQPSQCTTTLRRRDESQPSPARRRSSSSAAALSVGTCCIQPADAATLRPCIRQSTYRPISLRTRNHQLVDGCEPRTFRSSAPRATITRAVLGKGLAADEGGRDSAVRPYHFMLSSDARTPLQQAQYSSPTSSHWLIRASMPASCACSGTRVGRTNEEMPDRPHERRHHSNCPMRCGRRSGVTDRLPQQQLPPRIAASPVGVFAAHLPSGRATLLAPPISPLESNWTMWQYTNKAVCLVCRGSDREYFNGRLRSSRALAMAAVPRRCTLNVNGDGRDDVLARVG